VPNLLRTVVHLTRAEGGRVYVRLEHPAIERKDLQRLMTCPLFARVMGPSPLTLVFDPDARATDEREERRAAMLDELRQVAPELAPHPTTESL